MQIRSWWRHALLCLACLCQTGAALAASVPVRENFIGQAAAAIRAGGEKSDIDDILPVFGMALAERLPIGSNQISLESGRLAWPVYEVEQLPLAAMRINLLRSPGPDASVLWLTRRGKLQQWFTFEEEVPSRGLTRIGRGNRELGLVELVSTATQGSHLLIIDPRGKVVEDLHTESKLNEFQFYPGTGPCLLEMRASGVSSAHLRHFPATRPPAMERTALHGGESAVYPRYFCVQATGHLREYRRK